MNKLLQVGITGGIGSGKSLVCKIFSSLGIPIYDADSRAKWLTSNNETIKASIIAHFGAEAYTGVGLNREYIAGRVFNNKQELEVLNGIIHPEVGKDYKLWVESQSSAYVIKEAALMFESGSYKVLDKVINVTAPVPLRIQRVLKRDAFRTEKEIQAIIDKQLSDEERIKRSDYIINNDEQEMLIPQVLKLHEEFKSSVT
ncbi:dephospho-CoA kinase [Fulvivirga lutimaris]|uniref:dephospho-CoA kinase n=1 Tax=Fulvivirga lutimaris TaxID=1819566 RepID=UPI0012BC9AAD|nr:dephospho-CoA kinase [Fulvivirga lutimaris]MTI41599.1 dephospho-CoA kinase [Fulvivirga lutimaris]